MKQVTVYAHNGEPAGEGTLELFYCSSVLHFGNRNRMSNGTRHIADILYTQYAHDYQTMYVRTHEICELLKTKSEQTQTK